MRRREEDTDRARRLRADAPATEVSFPPVPVSVSLLCRAEEGTGDGVKEGGGTPRTPPSWATYKGPGQAACLRSESEVCQSPLGGYAMLLFVFRFLFFSAFLSFFTVFFLFLYFSFVLSRFGFCFIFCAGKKTFQLTNAKQISNKSAKFPLTNKFLADFPLLCVSLCVYECVFFFCMH